MKTSRKRVKPKPPPLPLGRVLVERGVSIGELSRRSGISRPLLSAYVNGHVAMSWPTLWEVAVALGASLGDFEPRPLSEEVPLER